MLSNACGEGCRLDARMTIMMHAARRKASTRRPPAEPLDGIATGKYICDAVLELRNLSRKAGLVFLAQLLEMTYHEAFMIANRVTPPAAEMEEVNRIIAEAKAWSATR